MRIIIKISFLLILVLAVFIGVRLFSADQDFIPALDDWLDQFQQQSSVELDEDNDEAEEEEEGDEDDDDVPSRVEIFQGLPAVKLSDEVITRSGILLARIETISSLHETRTVGKVLSLLPLLEQRANYQKFQSDLKLTTEELRAATKIYQRLRVLHKERANISLRQVEEARSVMNVKNTHKYAAQQALTNLYDQTLLTWGQRLTDSAFGMTELPAETKDDFERLLNVSDVLILVTLPWDFTKLEPLTKLYVNSQMDRSQAIPARFISPAAQTNSLSQGLTYYYQASAESLRLGMNLTVWITSSDQFDTATQTGQNIPHSAVIWFGGQAWVYVKVADDLYSRRPIKTDRETDTGWFVFDTISTDEMVVTTGAQLLLSEELRWQIPDEDDD